VTVDKLFLLVISSFKSIACPDKVFEEVANRGDLLQISGPDWLFAIASDVFQTRID
jgi:hypothetical protein